MASAVHPVGNGAGVGVGVCEAGAAAVVLEVSGGLGVQAEFWAGTAAAAAAAGGCGGDGCVEADFVGPAWGRGRWLVQAGGSRVLVRVSFSHGK